MVCYLCDEMCKLSLEMQQLIAMRVHVVNQILSDVENMALLSH